MPLTAFQKQILKLLAANRSPDSHVAGGAALNAEPYSVRFSLDIDFFHDAEEIVEKSARQDAQTLLSSEYDVTWLTVNPTFFRALVEKGEDQLKLEWALDSAWRFFPVIEDDLMGWRLHDADLATNKALALGGRSETRDLLDIVMLDENFLPLEAIVWAACAKDPGFSPLFLLDQISRNSKIDPGVLEQTAAKPINAHDLKRRWIEIYDRAVKQVEKFRAETPGCLYVDTDGRLLWPENARDARRHEAFLGGCWPTIIGSAGRNRDLSI